MADVSDYDACRTAVEKTLDRQLKDRGELQPPGVPARSIAWLALHTPREFSGKCLDYDDPRISAPALEMFGESLA